MEDDQSINTVSYMDPDTLRPLVAWWIGGSYLDPFDPDTAVHGFFEIEQARTIARQLFAAAAISGAEACIAKMFLDLAGDTNGFGAKAKKAQQQAGVMLLESRKYRDAVDLGPHISVIFGFHSRKALVDVSLYPVRCQWEAEQVTQHAIDLLQCAEAAQSDAFLTNFLTTKAQIDFIDARKMVQQFKVYRQQQQLEQLL